MFFTKKIYADTASATPLDRRVKRAMNQVQKVFGNPASIHAEGVLAGKTVSKARSNIAKILKCDPDEIIFTGSGTEANNLAISGTASVWESERKDAGHMIASAIEHHSVLRPVKALMKRGWGSVTLTVDQNGFINLKELDSLLSYNTALVSVGLVNNEIGTIQPIKEIAKRVKQIRKINRSRFPYFHIDACQAPRFLEINVLKLGADLITLNSSKIYGPKGVGLLYKSRDTKLDPIIFGGGQEGGLRSGTSNVVGIVGFAKALALCEKLRTSEVKKITAIRDYFIKRLDKEISGIVLNGDRVQRSPNNVNVSIEGVGGELLVIELDAKKIYTSSGSACSFLSGDESHVVYALSHSDSRAENSIRFSFGRDVTKGDVKKIIKTLKPIVTKIRQVKVK